MKATKRLGLVTTTLAAIAAALLATGTAPAHAAVDTYISVLTPSGSSGTKVLDIANWSLADRGRAHLWALRFSGEVRNQRWTTEWVGSLNGHGVYRLHNSLSRKCLDKSEDVPNANGNAVYQYSCHSGNNQKWEFIPGNDSVSRWGHLKNVAAGRCLDVQGPSFTNGATIHVWDCYTTWSQRWNID